VIDPREMAESLSPAMRHAVLRCSDAPDWIQHREVSFARDWGDVVAGFRMCTYRGTLKALERRGIVEIDTRGARGVRLTLYGLEVQAALR
jgi:hypothetical protein